MADQIFTGHYAGRRGCQRVSKTSCSLSVKKDCENSLVSLRQNRKKLSFPFFSGIKNILFNPFLFPKRLIHCYLEKVTKPGLNHMNYFKTCLVLTFHDMQCKARF